MTTEITFVVEVLFDGAGYLGDAVECGADPAEPGRQGVDDFGIAVRRRDAARIGRRSRDEDERQNCHCGHGHHGERRMDPLGWLHSSFRDDLHEQSGMQICVEKPSIGYPRVALELWGSSRGSRKVPVQRNWVFLRRQRRSKERRRHGLDWRSSVTERSFVKCMPDWHRFRAADRATRLCYSLWSFRRVAAFCLISRPFLLALFISWPRVRVPSGAWWIIKEWPERRRQFDDLKHLKRPSLANSRCFSICKACCHCAKVNSRGNKHVLIWGPFPRILGSALVHGESSFFWMGYLTRCMTSKRQQVQRNVSNYLTLNSLY